MYMYICLLTYDAFSSEHLVQMSIISYLTKSAPIYKKIKSKARWVTRLFQLDAVIFVFESISVWELRVSVDLMVEERSDRKSS